MSTFNFQQMITGFTAPKFGGPMVSAIGLIEHYLAAQLRPTWNSLTAYQKDQDLPRNEIEVPAGYAQWLVSRLQNPAVTLKLRETVTRIYAHRMGEQFRAALHALDEMQDALCGVGMQFSQDKPAEVQCYDMFGQEKAMHVQPWLTDRIGDVKIEDAATAPGLLRAMMEPFDLLAYAYSAMPITGGLGQLDDDLCIVFEVPLPTRESEAQAQQVDAKRRVKVDPLRYRTEQQMLPRIHQAVGELLLDNPRPWLTVVRPVGNFKKVSAYPVLWGIIPTHHLRKPGVGPTAIQSAFSDIYKLAAESTMV